MGRRAVVEVQDEPQLNTADAAAFLGLSKRQVQQLAAHGQITGAVKLGRDWRFPAKPRVIRPKRGPPVTEATAAAVLRALDRIRKGARPFAAATAERIAPNTIYRALARKAKHGGGTA